MKAEEIIREYEKLVERACKVLAGAPYWKSSADRIFARLTISGDIATLAWPEADSSYDSCLIEEQTAKFPVGLLFIDDASLDEWKAEAAADYKRQREQSDRLYAEMKRKEDLAMLAALKAKYEPTS